MKITTPKGRHNRIWPGSEQRTRGSEEEKENEDKGEARLQETRVIGAEWGVVSSTGDERASTCTGEARVQKIPSDS